MSAATDILNTERLKSIPGGRSTGVAAESGARARFFEAGLLLPAIEPASPPGGLPAPRARFLAGLALLTV